MTAMTRRAILFALLAVPLGAALVVLLRDPPWEAYAPTTAPDTEPFWAAALQELSEADFDLPSADWRLNLPEDHGAHPEMRTESWSIVAHLETAEGEGIGVQFAFVRIGVTPPGESRPASVWDIDTLHRTHVILTVASEDRAVGEERFGRGIPGLAGFEPDEQELRMDNWVVDFSETETGAAMTLSATVQDAAVLRLSLAPVRPPLSSEASEGGGPIAGYGFTRLAVEGSLDRGGGAEPLEGTAWFDHLWGELPLPGGSPIVWDRLQVQLSDGTDLSFARSRRRDGRGSPILDGFMVTPDQTVSTFDETRVEMTPTRTWRHPETDARYPVEWQIVAPNLDLKVEPVIDAQALDFAVPMWSGLVQVSGTRAGMAVSGNGTLQLTGYAER